jgi:hypothetical protein
LIWTFPCNAAVFSYERGNKEFSPLLQKSHETFTTIFFNTNWMTFFSRNFYQINDDDDRRKITGGKGDDVNN